jgi:hypothetical protein
MLAFRQKGRDVLLRRAILIGALVFLGFLTGCGDAESQGSSATRGRGPDAGKTGERATPPVSRQYPSGEAGRTVENTVEETSGRLRCSEEDRTGRGEIRIGDFEPPEEVPAYEILEEKLVERDDAKAARLLVGTRARSEEDYTLITRDLKYRYAGLDALSVEFTDTRGTLSYNGGAVIFNNPCGSDYIGYIVRPPNNDGYHVIVPKD